jgi:hypothetical protein
MIMPNQNLEAVASLMEDIDLSPEETETIFKLLGDLSGVFSNLQTSDETHSNKDIVSWIKTELTPEMILKLQSQIGKNRKLMEVIQKIFMKKLNEI